MSYAARHPDLFETALSFSGAPDTAYDLTAQLLVTPVVNATETFFDGVPLDSIVGPRLSEEINWAAHDPTTLAENLRGMNLFIYTGNGASGPLDSGPPNPEAIGVESGVHELNVLFHQRLQALGIPSLYDDYGAGTHNWPYWARDLRWSIAAIMSDFKHPPAAPSKVTYTSAESHYSVFGWRVVMHRAVAEFSTLRDASLGGFTLDGPPLGTTVYTTLVSIAP